MEMPLLDRIILRLTAAINKSILPERLVLRLAKYLVWLRPLEPYPNWSFGAGDEFPSPMRNLRLAIWKYCNNRNLQKPILSPWYNDLDLFLYLGNDTSRLLFLDGNWEPNEFCFLSKFLKPGMTFIDVGANEGLYSLFAANLVGPRGRVISIEPSDREIERLKKNIHLNQLNNIAVFECGAYSHSIEALLCIAEYKHEGHNTIGDRIPNRTVKSEGFKKIQLKPLDELMVQAGIEAIDFIKIDVEGVEAKVLIGATESIHKFKPVLQLEINEEALMQQGSSKQDLFEILNSHNYRSYAFGKLGELTPAPEIADWNDKTNIISASVDKVIC